MDPITYKEAGVDTLKAAGLIAEFSRYLKTRPRDKNLLEGVGPFAATYRLADVIGRYEKPVLVTSCDGVGTKLRLAIEWDHTEGLGLDLVAMNVNDLLCLGATPSLFLDYYACGNLSAATYLSLLKSIQDGCERAECTLAGGETAEMPGHYQGKDIDLAGFAIGFADEKNLLGAKKVTSGDTIIALASSGPHSNGFSLIRKLVEQQGLTADQEVPWKGASWKQVMLAPTHIYVKALKPVLTHVHAMAHITGGGLYENLPRVLPEQACAIIESRRWPFPALFQWLQNAGSLSTQEMLSTFNCGVGMLVICAPPVAGAVLDSATSHGISAWEIGRIETMGPEKGSKVQWH